MKKYFKYQNLLGGVVAGVGLFFLLNPTFLYGNTCQPISGGAEFEYLCTPRPNTPNCTPESSGGSICQGMPFGYSTQPKGTISINPNTIEKGASAVLSWSTTGTKDCTISNTYKADASGGSVTVKPEADGSFTLRCRGFDAEGNSVGDYVPVSSINFKVTSPPSEGGGGGAPALTETVNTNLQYVPLEPFVGVNQRGNASFGELIMGYFRILVNIGAFLAVAVLVVGGITYMVSESTVSKFVGKERVKASFIGLGILAAAWLILNTINPQLLTFDKDFLKPAGPTTVERRAALETEGVVTRDLTNSQMKKLRDRYGCPASTGVQCVGTKVLIFDPKKVKTATVQKEIKEYAKWCTDAAFWNFSNWQPKNDTPSSMFGVSGMTVHTCTRPVIGT